MTVVLYTKAGNDPDTIVWPLNGHPSERWEFQDGVPRECDGLFSHGDGSITIADGRLFPQWTAEGSSFAKSWLLSEESKAEAQSEAPEDHEEEHDEPPEDEPKKKPRKGHDEDEDESPRKRKRW